MTYIPSTGVLGTITYPCPDCGNPHMWLCFRGQWPRPLYKVQCCKCFHTWRVDRKKNDFFEGLLESSLTSSDKPNSDS